MSKIRIVVAVVVGALLVVAEGRPAAAQAPTRSGFFIGFGLGAGSYGADGASERLTSASAYFKLGGAVSSRVLLGAESDGWVKDEGGATITSGSLSAIAYVYPSLSSGFFLQGGLGLASLEVDAAGFGTASSTGTAVTLGVGFDIGFGGRFGLTPYGTLVLSDYEGGNTSLAHFGLGFNWY